MAVREFNGTSDRLVVDDGIIGQLANGAWTALLVLKWLTVGTGKHALAVENGSNQVIGVQDNGGSVRMALSDDNDFVDFSTTAIIAASTWSILAVTCTAAGATPKAHGKSLSGGSWVHQNGSGAFAGNTIDAAAVEFGSFNNGSFSSFWNGRLAVAAIFNTALADLTIESINTTPATATIYALTPQALWEFNQASVATTVTDLMGNGANETIRSGTTVINGDDPPGWTFGLGTAGAAGWVTTL